MKRKLKSGNLAIRCCHVLVRVSTTVRHGQLVLVQNTARTKNLPVTRHFDVIVCRCGSRCHLEDDVGLLEGRLVELPGENEADDGDEFVREAEQRDGYA